jgi:hypothetical protein
MDPNQAKQVPTMLQDLEIPNKKLTKWEESFVESITDQWERQMNLTDRQFEILEQIYTEKGSIYGRCCRPIRRL